MTRPEECCSHVSGEELQLSKTCSVHVQPEWQHSVSSFWNPLKGIQCKLLEIFIMEQYYTILIKWFQYLNT